MVTGVIPDANFHHFIKDLKEGTILWVDDKKHQFIDGILKEIQTPEYAMT